MQQLEAPDTVQGDLFEVLDIKHRQTVNRGGLGAHPIVVNHGGSLSGKPLNHTQNERGNPGLV